LRRLIAFALKLGLALIGLFVVLTLIALVITPPSTLMLARWASGQPVEHSTVPLSAIAPALTQAVIASEDARYCSHRGIDWGALQDVLDDEDGPSRGASTITMQTAKNVFLWPSRSYLRKGLEMPLALVLDLVWGKRRTIEIYLNMAEWGDGVFGAEAAARHHFGKAARDLTRREAAALAASLPNPRARDPARPSSTQRAHAGRILARIAGTPTACVAG
jgi:monofunctional biosynthetic peptidoglycan transglycosylase